MNDHPVMVSVALEALEAATAALERVEKKRWCPCGCPARHESQSGEWCDEHATVQDGVVFPCAPIEPSTALGALRKAIEWGREMRSKRNG